MLVLPSFVLAITRPLPASNDGCLAILRFRPPFSSLAQVVFLSMQDWRARRCRSRSAHRQQLECDIRCPGRRVRLDVGRTVLASDFEIQLRCEFSVDRGQLLLDLGDLLSKVLFQAENMWIVVRHQLEVLKRLETAFQGFEELKANYFPVRMNTLHGKRFLSALRCIGEPQRTYLRFLFSRVPGCRAPRFF